MYPKKGVLAAGSDADLVLWDPNADYTISAATHHMRVDYSMFEGFQVRGNARDVYSRGELMVERRQVHRQAGPRQVSAARGARRRVEVGVTSAASMTYGRNCPDCRHLNLTEEVP